MVRVPDEVWEAAKEKAEREGTTVSTLVQRWLREYVGRGVS
jgi:predicted HicB family RNase H-like nuclease